MKQWIEWKKNILESTEVTDLMTRKEYREALSEHIRNSQQEFKRSLIMFASCGLIGIIVFIYELLATR